MNFWILTFSFWYMFPDLTQQRTTHSVSLEMAMDQYLPQAAAQNASNEENGVGVEKWRSVSPTIELPEKDPFASFDYNICLDTVHDLVVTLWSHLYCWPCIYKWIHFPSVSTRENREATTAVPRMQN